MNANKTIYENNIRYCQKDIEQILPIYAQLKHLSPIDFQSYPLAVQYAITEKKRELGKELKTLHETMAKYQEYLERY